MTADELLGGWAAERARREQANQQLVAMTAPAAYREGDYVTFVLVANVTATVRIVEIDDDGGTSYAFSNGQIGAYRDHRVLTLWRVATPDEVELFEAHAVDQLGERVALPVGAR
ncbi:hypothetical protein [Actinokineospora enzanensis]|uniref:hypothetical protein n=1 Tax=Actinokineospora enzanensis TaxID=155975 RepID=UPI000476AAFF|nr:hypothetical protein [Actinokineospora enzanensis]